MAGDGTCTVCGAEKGSSLHGPASDCDGMVPGGCAKPEEHHEFQGAGVGKKHPRFMTVTLVVEYDELNRTPDDWDWDTLIDGRARVLNAWATEPDELERTFEDEAGISHGMEATEGGGEREA